MQWKYLIQGIILLISPSWRSVNKANGLSSIVIPKAPVKATQRTTAIPIEENLKKEERESVRYYHISPVDIPYSSAIKVIQWYNKEHGDLAIPRRFILPKSNREYPREWHGINLSNTIYDMKWWQRHISSHPHRVSELNELGFLWERLQPEWNLVLEALLVYIELHHDTLVPTNFIVPYRDGRYPEATWGIPLGNCVHRIRTRNDFVRGHPDRIAQLNRLEFVWDRSEHNFQKVVKALRYFGKFQNSGRHSSARRVLRVPTTFVIPDSAPWPKELWGFPLGAKCCAIRSKKQLYIKNNSHRKQHLEDLGFLFSGNACLGWLEVVHAAAIYSNLNGRYLCVPQNFVVPEEPEGWSEDGVEWPWPEQLWGLPLGQRLRDIRLKRRYLTCSAAPSRIAQLNALGFNWNPKRGRRKRQPQTSVVN